MRSTGSLVGEELHFILYLNNCVSISHLIIGQEQSVFEITKCFFTSHVPYCKEMQTYDGNETSASLWLVVENTLA